MTKAQFENLIEKWVADFVENQRGLNLIKIFKGKSISKISHPVLNQMHQSKLCDFNCDFVALVEHDIDGFQLILINRFTKSVGLKDIGEMLVYAKMANPLFAFIISAKGHSTEINNILVNDRISMPLFSYDDKSIILFALDKGIKKESVLPLHMRNFFFEKVDDRD